MTRARLLTLIFAVLAGVHAASYVGAGPVDDDFIVYRYAGNLISGEGLVFNAGERFEGFSVPLWVFSVAAALQVGLDPVLFSLVLSSASAVAATFAVGEAWRRSQTGSTWPVAALLVAASPAFAYHGVAGLGTTLLAALLATWYGAWEQATREARPATAAGVLLAAACLLRQECALFALPFAILEWRRAHSAKGAKNIGPLLPLVALVGWTAFRFAYYGRLFPIPYYVKKLPLGEDFTYGLAYLWQATAECGVLVFLAATLVAWAFERGRTRVAVSGAALGLVLHTLYVVWAGGDFMAHARFFIPTFPLLVLLGVRGAAKLLDGTPRLAFAAVVLALIGLQGPQADRVERTGEHAFFEDRWAALGRHFHKYAPSGSKVAISPIGAFGWYSKLEVVDILGLTHAAALDEVPELAIEMKGHHRFDGGWVLDQEPDFIILANGVVVGGQLVVNPWERTIVEDPRLAAQYTLMQAPIEGSDPLFFYRRKGGGTLPGAGPAGRTGLIGPIRR